MTKTIGVLADRMLSMFAPSATAGAVVCRDEIVCNLCSTNRSRKKSRRCCDPGGCGGWRDHGCGSC
jgi:predicted RNA-binding Zn ribbon-like protein